MKWYKIKKQNKNTPLEALTEEACKNYHEFNLFSAAFFLGYGGDRDRDWIPQWW
ncbi:hypothetical protein ACE1AT_22810 [Pelatocladus sp. BLCC-F211]|uniref:hypothetical protein n=1 Tax=Pelatocladus sp. BLCC-F211 TaxID=3342752 RepID=UPI0035B79B0F